MKKKYTGTTFPQIMRNFWHYIFFIMLFTVLYIFLEIDISSFTDFQSLIYVFMIVILLYLSLKNLVSMDLWYFLVGSINFLLLVSLGANTTIIYFTSNGIIWIAVIIDMIKIVLPTGGEGFPKLEAYVKKRRKELDKQKKYRKEVQKE